MIPYWLVEDSISGRAETVIKSRFGDVGISLMAKTTLVLLTYFNNIYLFTFLNFSK